MGSSIQSGSEPSTVVVATEASIRIEVPMPGPAIGDRLGRYQLLDLLGAGGMGWVFRARDLELQRDVALKVLRPRRSGEALDEAQKRMAREGRAMAAIDSPHVVKIFDVDTDLGRLFIAMELVDGMDLGRWMKRSRGWRAVLEVFVAAARGLEHAHERGLVHRDFKPSNVLVANDGRVLVTDFGLAKGRSEQGSSEGPFTQSSSGSEHVTLTGAGTVVGTPPYMAPEQFEAPVADPRVDQYAFCVSLYEALVGHRPFVAPGLHELVELKRRGPGRPTFPREVPSRLARAVLRGLHPDPARRWPSMRALVHALEGGLRPTARSRRLPWVAGLGLAAGLGWVGTVEPPSPCESPNRTIDRIYGEPLRDALAQRWFGQARPGSEVAGQLRDELDTYAAAWAENHTRACERAIAAESMIDGELECLGLAHSRFAAVVEWADRATTANGLQQARRALQSLPAPAACDELEVQLVPADPGTAQTVQRIRTLLSRANMEAEYRWDFEAADRELVEAERAGRSLDFPPIGAEIDLARGRWLTARGDSEEGLGRLEAAYFAARKHEHDVVAAEAALSMVFVLALELGDMHRAERWIPLAHALVERLPRGRQHAMLESYLGSVELARGRPAEALPRLRRALQMHVEFGHDLYAQAGEIQDIAIALNELGRRTEADAEMRRAIGLLEVAAAGQPSADLGVAYYDYGVFELDADRADEALRWFERALEQFEATYGLDHPHTARVRVSLGETLAALDRFDDAQPHYVAGIAALERGHGPDHPAVVMAKANYASALADHGELARAAELLEAVRAYMEATAGPEHPDTAMALAKLAAVRSQQRRTAEAIGLLEAAIEIRRAAYGSGSILVARSTLDLARVVDAHGDRRRARVLMGEARAIFAGLEPSAEVEASLDEITAWRARDRQRSQTSAQP